MTAIADLESEDTVASLHKVIELLKRDLENLKEENKRLLSANGINHNKWEVVAGTGKKNRPNLNLACQTQSPPLFNRFSALSSSAESDCNLEYNSKEIKCIPKIISKRTRPMNIHLYSDSQGRGVYKDFCKQDTNHKFTAMVKPGAKFSQVVDGVSELGQCDIPVFLAGTNDIAHNEQKGLLSSLKKKLYELRSARQVVVFSVPHRYDLANWSIVNKELSEANEAMSRVCKHFSNVIYIDISKLDRRFHTTQGFHLNALGKKYISNKILETVNSIAMIHKLDNNSRPKTIPLGYSSGSFLENVGLV